MLKPSDSVKTIEAAVRARLSGAKPSEAPVPPAAPPVRKSRMIVLQADIGGGTDRSKAEMAASPSMGAAIASAHFSSAGFLGDVSLPMLDQVLKESGARVNRGDLSGVEAMLNSQSVALNLVFAELTSRASANLGTHIDAVDKYLRLALKAQSQCRATLETLAAIKNPPVVFARQANINNGGQQQVNNNAPLPLAPARVGEIGNTQNKLLEDQHANQNAIEPYLDGSKAQTPERSNPALEAVGTINRPKNRRRQGSSVA